MVEWKWSRMLLQSFKHCQPMRILRTDYHSKIILGRDSILIGCIKTRNHRARLLLCIHLRTLFDFFTFLSRVSVASLLQTKRVYIHGVLNLNPCIYMMSLFMSCVGWFSFMYVIFLFAGISLPNLPVTLLHSTFDMQYVSI